MFRLDLRKEKTLDYVLLKAQTLETKQREMFKISKQKTFAKQIPTKSRYS